MTVTTEACALGRLADIVSKRAGIVSEARLVDLEPGDPALFVAESDPARMDGLIGRPAANQGAGAALSARRALIKALAESVERYCAAFPVPGSVRAAWNELEADALTPAEFVFFSAEQYRSPAFPFVPFERSTVIGWVPGRLLAGDAPILVPAPMVQLPYQRARGEPRLCSAVSTGLAAGASWPEAASGALREVVERDAFMVVWRRELVTPAIDLERLPPGPHRRLLDALLAAGVRCRARLLTVDVALPVVAIVAGRPGAAPHLVMGVGTHEEPLRALQLALEETCLSLYGINRLVRRLGDQVAEMEPRDLRTLVLQSVAYAVRPELTPHAWFLVDPPPVTLSSAELDERFARPTGDPLQWLSRVLGPYAERAALVDCTTPDIRDLGLRVARAIIPGLQPLDHDHACRHLGGARLGAGPLNTNPHPFP